MSQTTIAPLDSFAFDGYNLYLWLGSFWTQIYEDQAFVRNQQYGQGMFCAQNYLNYLESLDLLNRKEVPALHRERWTPLIIRLSERDTGSGLAVNQVPTPELGPQTSIDFPSGITFKVGGSVQYRDIVTYPVQSDIVNVLSCLADNIIAPGNVLVRDRDFTYEDGVLYILRARDPFSVPTWPKRTIQNADGTTDTEILLWGTDTLVDWDFVYSSLGYVLGLKTPSTEFFQRALNGLWTLYNDGTPLRYLWGAIGALLGEPTVISQREVITSILVTDGAQQVVTDRHVYRLPLNAQLAPYCKIGAELQQGSFLSATLRLYETLDPAKLQGCSPYGQQLRTDIASFFFTEDMLRADVRYGVGATWDQVPIVKVGDDANGNAKLQFQLYGDQQDLETFWQSFWQYCEQRNIAARDCFPDNIDARVSNVDGAQWGRISPLDYMMRYMLRANAAVLVVDRDRLSPDVDFAASAPLFATLSRLVPAHVLLFCIERRDVGPEIYDMATGSETKTRCWAKLPADEAYEGPPSQTHMTYQDRGVVIKLVPQCR